mmetsp:Transcript_49031/g.138758  ORF Transcript_49031/g.138758 Transcript_49031/m.138758 type:complete len:212 (+) Transcript_49031:214-849(+)
MLTLRCFSFSESSMALTASLSRRLATRLRASSSALWAEAISCRSASIFSCSENCISCMPAIRAWSSCSCACCLSSVSFTSCLASSRSKLRRSTNFLLYSACASSCSFRLASDTMRASCSSSVRLISAILASSDIRSASYLASSSAFNALSLASSSALSANILASSSAFTAMSFAWSTAINASIRACSARFSASIASWSSAFNALSLASSSF